MRENMDKVKNNIKRFKAQDGIEYMVALECTINNRKFIITTDKQLFEKDGEAIYRANIKNDVQVKILEEYLKEPKSLDIIEY